jgi:hypothetical protein
MTLEARKLFAERKKRQSKNTPKKCRHVAKRSMRGRKLRAIDQFQQRVQDRHKTMKDELKVKKLALTQLDATTWNNLRQQVHQTSEHVLGTLVVAKSVSELKAIHQFQQSLRKRHELENELTERKLALKQLEVTSEHVRATAVANNKAERGSSELTHRDSDFNQG